jgi:NADP-dependent 3-hydroxy acid dehydrogenase YdfG
LHTIQAAKALASSLDVTKDIMHLVDELASSDSHLDYMFNNAGIAIGGGARDLTMEH